MDSNLIMEASRDKMMEGLNCYNCSINFINLDEFNSHQCPEAQSSDPEFLMPDIDVKVKIETEEEEIEENGHAEIPSLNTVQQDVSINYYTGPFSQQQSNVCLVGEDTIYIYCKKCSTDFHSLKLFLEHLHRKSHQPVITPISKENQPPPHKKVRLINSTSLSTSSSSNSNSSSSKKIIVVPISNKSQSHQNSSQIQRGECPPVIKTYAAIKPIKKADSSSSSTSKWVLPSDTDSKSKASPLQFTPSDLELDADPKSDPLELTPPVTQLVARTSYNIFKCNFCGDKFWSAMSLKAHQKKVIPKTPCDKLGCFYSFTLNCALLKHKEYHQKQSECQANTQKNAPKTYSRAHRTYSAKKSNATIATTTTLPGNMIKQEQEEEQSNLPLQIKCEPDVFNEAGDLCLPTTTTETSATTSTSSSSTQVVPDSPQIKVEPAD